MVVLLAMALAFAQSALPNWNLHAALWTATPPALKTGLAVGGAIEAQFPLGDGPFFAAGRLALGDATEASTQWLFDDYETQALVALGMATKIDLAQLWFSLGAGGLLIEESLHRQQYQRLQADGIAGTVQSAWTMGPVASAELGVALNFAGAWSAVISGGPTVTRLNVSGARVVRWGGTAQLGVGYAF